jgi:cyclopropane-fatty-acyl-phospholipid synthase|tara:strand:- start:229 stop:1275 length:1047 start_codon:yes stop_codon:yes gene_type:complete
MKISNNKHISFDKFVDIALYHKKTGYYMKKNPFGKDGDFITAPNISILFSEMLAIWCIAFWEHLGYPKKINIIELGAGNGEMMYQMIKVFERFNKFRESSNYFILEKSQFLKKIQKKKLNSHKITWLNSINKLKNGPNIFLANEFFDALPIKQFIKKKNKWYEKSIKKNNINKFEFVNVITNIKNLEKKIEINLSKNQKIIEFSPLTYDYLNIISKKINTFQGGLLIVDYGYLKKKMRDSLQSIYKHKFNNILDNFSKSDITYNLNFFLLKKIVKKLNLKVAGLTSQRNFLTRLGILNRAEILAKNLQFSKKADIYYRIKRLIDRNFMGELFKVMFVTGKNIKFKLGF